MNAELKTFRTLLEGLITQGASNEEIVDWLNEDGYPVPTAALVDLIRVYVTNPFARFHDIQINLYSDDDYQKAMGLIVAKCSDADEWTIVVDGELLTPEIQQALALLKAEYKINWR